MAEQHISIAFQPFQPQFDGGCFLLRPRDNIWEESDGCYLSFWLVAYFNNPYPTATFVWNLKSKLCPFFAFLFHKSLY